MPLLKRASERLEKMGIAIEVHMGPYGPYLHDPFLRRQRTYVYKSAEEAVQAALHGVRPTPDYKTRADGWPLCPSCGEDELWSPLVWEDVSPLFGLAAAAHVVALAGWAVWFARWE